MSKQLWCNETFKNAQSFSLSVDEVLYKKQSDYQEVLIFENATYGTVMMLDGAYMLSDLDEHMYHKALTTYGMSNLPENASKLNILVIGGGDGGIVRDLLTNYDAKIAKVTMVEIDEAVIEASRKYFPQIAAKLNDPKLDLRVMDALKYVDEAPAKHFDLVLCDSTDPVGFAAGLIETEFYLKLKRIMKDEAVFCAQSGSPFFQKEELECARTNLAKVFSEVQTYYAPMLVYPGTIWSYTAAGRQLECKTSLPLNEFVDKL
jgi:spermidine synthase